MVLLCPVGVIKSRFRLILEYAPFTVYTVVMAHIKCFKKIVKLYPNRKTSTSTVVPRVQANRIFESVITGVS